MKLQAQLAEYTVRLCRRKTTVRKNGMKITFNPKKLAGLCDYNTKTLFIASDLSPDTQFTSLWHEYVHAILFELDRDSLSRDEALVETLSQNIARAMRVLYPKE